jgi:hypothetical protein
LKISAVELYSGEKYFYIICHGSGYPNPRATWKRNGIEILDLWKSSANTRVYQQKYYGITDARSDLHFKKVYCNDAGNYTCEISVGGHDYVDTQYVELICKYFMYASHELGFDIII